LIQHRHPRPESIDDLTGHICKALIYIHTNRSVCLMPRSKLPLKTRQRVLDSALEIFASKGYSQASMEEIASKAGVTKGALYWHFESKLDLYNALVNHVLKLQTQEIVPALLKEASSQSVVKALVRSHLNFYRRNPRITEFYSNMMMEGKTLSESGIMEIMAHAYRSYREAVTDALAMGCKKGKNDAKGAAMVLIGALDGIVMQWMMDPDGFDLDDAEQALVRIYAGWEKGA
jgi:TetR/AcrR family acrAB operon transcriptional repressor